MPLRNIHLLLLSPLALLWAFLDESCKKRLRADMYCWQAYQGRDWKSNGFALLNLLRNKEFRAVFYHRVKCSGSLGRIGVLFSSMFYRPCPTLVIYTQDIGGGLFIQHGLCTIIAAAKIGRDAWINQGVTIGYVNDDDCPVIGNSVVVGAGAKVLGAIEIGDNVVVGANAVVTKSVPPNCTVVGIPARIIKRAGQRVDEPL